MSEHENTTAVSGVTGKHTTGGVPHGSTSITPFITVAGAAQAIDFYTSVFGARLVDANEIGGITVHAELDFGNGRLQLGEPNPDYGLVADPTGDAACYSLALYCGDAHATVARAEAAGATIREPLMTFVSGDRFASILDRFGVRWSVMSRVEDLSEEESTRRVAEWAATQG